MTTGSLITGVTIEGALYLPRRSVPIRGNATGSNTNRQRAAVKQMTECELVTGLTAEQIDAMHAEQRARVRARYGL